MQGAVEVEAEVVSAELARDSVEEELLKEGEAEELEEELQELKLRAQMVLMALKVVVEVGAARQSWERRTWTKAFEMSVRAEVSSQWVEVAPFLRA